MGMAGMDSGIPKCMVIRCSNISKLNPQTFKAQTQVTNIYFRGQPSLVFSQHKSYFYLGINLVPSLQWKTQTHVATTKPKKQQKFLITCLATMKHKINMADTIIRVGIAYNFYSIPYLLLAIKEPYKKLTIL